MKTLSYLDRQPVKIGDTFTVARWGTCTVESFDELNACAVAVNTATGERFDMLGQPTFGEADLISRAPEPGTRRKVKGWVPVLTFANGGVQVFASHYWTEAAAMRAASSALHLRNRYPHKVIAAAPELLAHLKMLVLGISEGIDIPKEGAAITAALEAIAKAEGKA